jgi:hypothetical protein
VFDALSTQYPDKYVALIQPRDVLDDRRDDLTVAKTAEPVARTHPSPPAPALRAMHVISMECWAGGFCYPPPTPHFHSRTRLPAARYYNRVQP